MNRPRREALGARLLGWLRPRRAAGALAWSDREFVQRLVQALERQGWQCVDEAAGRGFDLALRRERETHLLQHRAWRAKKVDLETLVELHEAMTARGAAGGIAVTTGAFGRRASAYAARANIRLIDGPLLDELLARRR